MRKIFLLLMIIVPVISSALGSIKGKISNNEGAPIEGVSIQILNFSFQAVSDKNGIFELAEVPSGNYTLVFKYLGYQTEYLKITISTNENLNLQINLKQGTINLNNEVVISASRIKEEQFDISYSVNSIHAEDIEMEGSRTSAEALMQHGGWVQKTNHGGGSPFIRGLTGYHTLVIIDGVRFNNSIFRSGPNQYVNTIDPLSIAAIEIVRGNGSTQYGSDALGGTVQFFSKPPEFSKQKKNVVPPGSLL
ncbi:MAG: TonB-dependent receptor [Bacteroidales bacterium]|nr:TonB-dependent receptor [Bacteroidales bacterium]